MLLKAYAIYDRKGLIYNAPFFAPAVGHATRSFADLANDTNTMVGRHPADFTLYYVGAYDDQSGLLIPVTALEHIVDAQTLVKEQPDLFRTPPTGPLVS